MIPADRGLAALAERLPAIRRLHTAAEDAAAILANGAVFLPDGLPDPVPSVNVLAEASAEHYEHGDGYNARRMDEQARAAHHRLYCLPDARRWHDALAVLAAQEADHAE